MIIWTVTGGASGAADTRQLAAAQACDAGLDWLRERSPALDVGDHLPVVTICVDDADARVFPRYDRRSRYDEDATVRAAHHARDQLAAVTDRAAWPAATGPHRE